MAKMIEIRATSIEYFIYVTNEEGEKISKLDFGDMYFGTKKSIQFCLVNNSPTEYVYGISFLPGISSYQNLLPH